MTDMNATQTAEMVQPGFIAGFFAFVRARVRERWEIARELPKSGTGLTIAAVILNIVLGVLPVLFILGTSFMLGRVPA
ncbi:MAG TPA: hypothetical protein VII05_05750, partial [Gaiellaceae bacterium]